MKRSRHYSQRHSAARPNRLRAGIQTLFIRSTNKRRRGLLAGLVAALLALPLVFSTMRTSAAGTISLTALGSAYTQNFDTLAVSGTSSTVPTGWDFSESGTSANTTYTAGSGSGNTGDTYSFGTGTNTDRAFGGLQSGNLVPTIGASFTNNTGAAITSLAIAYTGEQWRLGTSARGADRLDFQYSTNATSLATGAWTDVDSLDFSSLITTGTVGALDGNAAANRAAISFTITGLNIANGAVFWIRWNDFNVSNADDGLAVDDFSLTPSGSGGGGSTNPSGVGAANPSTVVRGNSTLLTVAVTPGTNPTSTGLGVTADLTAIGGSATQPFFDDGSNGDVSGGDNIFSFNATVAVGTTTGGKSLPFTITDAQARSGPGTISLTITAAAGSTRIHDIQGATHTSPLVGQAVTNIPGIVTALAANGFYLQDPTPDADDATSEAIFVFTSTAPTVAIGHSVTVNGNVQEFRPSGTSSTNLTITEIAAPTVSVVSTGNSLPAPVVIGTGGRVPPTAVIEDDATGSVETSGVFDPATDGIDFYESLEGMRVQINNAVVVGPTQSFTGATPNREMVVIGDNGANATSRTTRGGIVITTTDFNPERIFLNDLLPGATALPSVSVNDSFPGAIIGVMDYTFGDYKLQVQSVPAVMSGGLALEATTAAGTNQIAIATFNCENLDPGDGATKFDSLADIVVNRLMSPDLVTLEEIQDNNGATDNGTVSCTTTMNMLIAAIQGKGGPTYAYRQIDPVNDQDGGEPGGNIRQVFMFRTDRGLSFIDRAGGTSTAATTVVNGGTGPQLSFSPGRIDPSNTAWSASRKPLAGEFMYNGSHFFVIGNHFNSKGGDQPLYGRFQPPTLSSEVQRLQQAQIVHDFVNSILSVDASANVVVLGDLNDFEFSNPLATLKGSGAGTILHALIETLPANERYSYVFEGNSQTLDHILISNNLFNNVPFAFDVVHVNSEFAVQASDHDPSVVRFTLAPTAVKLESFSATAQGSEVLLRWQTGEEADNLGFNLYREEAGQRLRVTPQIVAGSALVASPGTTLSAGRSYSWWDAQARAGARYWLEEIDLNGKSVWYGPVTIKASSGNKQSAAADRQAVMLNALGRDQIQESATRPVEVTADEVQLAAKLPASINLGAQSAVKITVSREGWYRVTQPELIRAGLDPKVNPRMLQLYVDGREQPMLITSKSGAEFGSTDALEFYGVGLDTQATNTRVYWLVAGNQPGRRIEQIKGAGLKSAPASFAYTVERKDRTIYFSGLRNGDRENFFGPVVTRTPVKQSITLEHLAAQSAEQAVAEITLQGVTASSHKVSILLNGSAVGTASFDGQESYTERVNVASASLKEGENVVSLAAQGGDTDISLIDAVRVTYPHSFTADHNALRLTIGSKQPVTIDGFTSNAIRVFDVTNWDAPQEIIGTVKSQKNGYGVTVTAMGGGTRRLLTITNDQAQRSPAVTANQPSSWRQTGQSADFIIITHSSLIESARQLQAYRESRGLRVALVDVEDIYDEFSFGNKSAYAIRDFLAYAKENWQRAPQFVLLMGDATYDPKDYLGHGDFDLVPTRLIDTQTMETASDDWLVDFEGKGFAALAVGRLPVRGADEAARMIAKIIGYESTAGSDSALIISDNNDGFDFEGAGAQLRELFPETIKAGQIDRGELGTAVAKKALLDGLQRGQRIVNYIGHGSADTWRDGLLTSAEARGLTNGDRLPLFVAMTCLNGYFQDTSGESLAESLMKAERGGAIAVWASSGMTLPGAQSRMNQQFYRLMFEADTTQGKSLGEVTLRAKSSVSDGDVRRTWILFGDPTTMLR
ncbi:MAG: C25 family cysteine peptidase [Blastocatellia bacterium]